MFMESSSGQISLRSQYTPTHFELSGQLHADVGHIVVVVGDGVGECFVIGRIRARGQGCLCGIVVLFGIQVGVVVPVFLQHLVQRIYAQVAGADGVTEEGTDVEAHFGRSGCVAGNGFGELEIFHTVELCQEVGFEGAVCRVGVSAQVGG